MQVQLEWWQVPKYEESTRRMTPHHEAVIAVDGVSPPAWLHAADILVAEHRTRRQARRWIAAVYQRYPECVVAAASHRRGRWCVVGLPARNIVMRGGRFDLVAAEQLGRVVYHLWQVRRTRL